MKKFIKKDLEFYLPESFRGLSKKYIVNKIFDKELQKSWCPRVGDLIVGCTGNIFVISAKEHLHEKLGGDLFFFGGGLCTRDGSCFMNETFCYTMNKSGKWIEVGVDGHKEKDNCYHSAIKDFRFIPYINENYSEKLIEYTIKNMFNGKLSGLTPKEIMNKFSAEKELKQK